MRYSDGSAVGAMVVGSYVGAAVAVGPNVLLTCTVGILVGSATGLKVVLNIEGWEEGRELEFML